MQFIDQIKSRFRFIYKSDIETALLEELINAVEETKQVLGSGKVERWNEQDIILITYGDSILSEGERPLQTLRKFLLNKLKEEVSIVHILPFFPYSSDDGFSVIDYTIVNPELGDWEDITDLNLDFKLMADLVINHISAKSEWFRNYLKGKNPGNGFFIEVDPSTDLSKVVRPRSLPLLTKVDTSSGEKHVWTTFSADQIDLNFGNPKLLVEMIKVFLLYLQKGSKIIRLDAIAFLWKEIGTSCLHLPETHEVVKLMRDVVDYIDPGIVLLTETNVPNKENLSYFGNGDEATMVYQFSLPPLLLHALYTGNSAYLNKWVDTISDIPDGCTFFNFTASHDGIGVRPLEGLLPEDEFKQLLEGMKSQGGFINTKRNSDGTDSPYEMNITYFDAMKGTCKGEDDCQIARFIASQTVMMSMKGVPAFYIHSLLATTNYYEGVKETGMNRTINRRKWKVDELYPLLDSETHHSFVLKELSRRIRIRKKIQHFHPDASQILVENGREFFAFIRGENDLLVLVNLSSEKQHFDAKIIHDNKLYYDALTGEALDESLEQMRLMPYQVCWLVMDLSK